MSAVDLIIAGMLSERVRLRRWVAVVLVPLLAAWPATAGLVFVHAHEGHPRHVHPPLVAMAPGTAHPSSGTAGSGAHAAGGHGRDHGHSDSHSHPHPHSHSHGEEDHHLADAEVVVVAKLIPPVLAMPPLLPCGTVLPPQALQAPAPIEWVVVAGGGGERPTSASRIAGILRAGHALLL